MKKLIVSYIVTLLFSCSGKPGEIGPTGDPGKDGIDKSGVQGGKGMQGESGQNGKTPSYPIWYSDWKTPDSTYSSILLNNAFKINGSLKLSIDSISSSTSTHNLSFVLNPSNLSLGGTLIIDENFEPTGELIIYGRIKVKDEIILFNNAISLKNANLEYLISSKSTASSLLVNFEASFPSLDMEENEYFQLYENFDPQLRFIYIPILSKSRKSNIDFKNYELIKKEFNIPD